MNIKGSTMDVYNGLLVGGPYEGNQVTGSTNKIPVVSTIEFWLDGPEKDRTIYMMRGSYVWQKENEYFLWQPEDSALFSEVTL